MTALTRRGHTGVLSARGFGQRRDRARARGHLSGDWMALGAGNGGMRPGQREFRVLVDELPRASEARHGMAGVAGPADPGARLRAVRFGVTAGASGCATV
jgi:hypothetical protein